MKPSMWAAGICSVGAGWVGRSTAERGDNAHLANARPALNQPTHKSHPRRLAGTKVVCTVGPSCQEVDTMCEMLDAGVVGCRVDLTWGPLEFHRKSLANLQQAMRKSRRLCCTMVDTLGRELMIRRQVRGGCRGRAAGPAAGRQAGEARRTGRVEVGRAWRGNGERGRLDPAPEGWGYFVLR